MKSNQKTGGSKVMSYIFFNFFNNFTDEDYMFFALGLLGAIGTIFGILSFVLKKKIKPVFLVDNYRFVRGASDMEGIKITYLDKDISNLSSTKILFYNSGKKDIRKEDIPETDPIIIKVSDDYEILDSRILFESNKKNNFKIEQLTPNIIKLSFEFISHKDGCVLQLLNTASYTKEISIEGTIIDYGTLSSKQTNIFSTIEKIASVVTKSKGLTPLLNITGILYMLMSLFSFLMAILPSSIYEPETDAPSISTKILFFVLSVVMFFAGLTFIQKKIPNRFKEHFKV